MSAHNDILIDPETKDVIIRSGDFVVGDSQDQEVELILTMNPGELKEDPLLGAGLMRLVQSNAYGWHVRQLASEHLARDGKSYEDIKKRIELKQ